MRITATLTRMLILLAVAGLIFLNNPAIAQKTDGGPDQSSTASDGQVERLLDVLECMEDLVAERKEKERALKRAGIPAENEAIAAELNELNARLKKRKEEFESIAAGGQSDLFAPAPADDTPFSLQSEIQEIIRPLVDELKSVTQRPREIERLRREIGEYEKQLKAVRAALAHVSDLMAASTEPTLKTALEEARTRWESKAETLQDEIDGRQYQLGNKLADKESIIETLKTGISNFFRTRGLHLLLALLTFFGVFFLLRAIHWKLFKAGATRSVYYRIFQVLYHFFTFLAALGIALLLLYNFGDWMILSILLIVLVGVVWTARHGLSKFWEQSKLLLNLGTVREGERLIYNGIPWEVAALNIQTTLSNPALAGGTVRLPLNSLIGMQTRPFHEDEAWFPTRPEDYVTLADGTFGRVILQTPENVTLDVLGGCRKTYPTGTFLSQNPVNLSINTFGVAITFGIDYVNQDKITTAVPEILKAAMEAELPKAEFGDDFLSVLVQFKEAAASSLDILVFASFAGNAAPYYYTIGRVLQTIAVDTCNAHGWEIPFTQITVHNAA